MGSAAVLVHDSGRQRAAATMVSKARVEQAASAAAGRLEILALETFAPASPWETRSSKTNQAELMALVRAQRSAQQCRCRDTLPADAFFQFDIATGTLTVIPASSTPGDIPETPVIEAVARSEADRARELGRSKVHLNATAPLRNHAVVTIVQSGENGASLSVFGLVANAGAIARAVFGDDSTRTDARASGATRNARDTLLLEVRRTDGSPPIYSSLADDHPFRATVIPSTGPLQGLRITAALTRRQAIRSLSISPQEMWHVGMLTLATVLVIAFAIGSSRRELLLARARSDFIAGVSHDLRMPLAQILIASETLTLRRERDETERLTLSSSIVREARRLIGIVDNVLLFSRSGAIALRPRLQPLPVSALFDDVIDAVKLAVEDAGQTIETREASPLAILGDRQLVRQALVNLIDNALKYGSPGQRIQLGAERHDAFVRLYVADEGPGVPASERARIFEPYERLARDQTSERTGTGLGLAVVRHIAQVCGGRVWLDESPGRGTRVVLELPIAGLPEPIVPERELV
jgi:signal transduction histidine kinase